VIIVHDLLPVRFEVNTFDLNVVNIEFLFPYVPEKYDQAVGRIHGREGGKECNFVPCILLPGNRVEGK
jgi:hypothetical protein